MIDFEKLQLAHEMSINTDYYWFSCQFGSEDDINDITLHNADTLEEIAFDDLDKLITKLQELTQPKPKYEVGQEIWFNFDESIYLDKIDNIDKDSYGQWQYEINSFLLKEHHLFLSREALIQAQIDYWESLKFDDAIEYVRKNHDGTVKNLASKECQHESDGGWYYSHGERMCGAALHFANAKPDKYKCKKCGEFY